MPQPPSILLTAFEPSGDNLGQSLVAALKQRQPDIQCHALGGPKLAHAGANLIENTSDDPAMLLDAARKVVDHRRRLQRLKTWLENNHVDAVIPIDSPAANWSICQATRQTQPNARIIHLVAPQLWAWGQWRIRKLRRLTDQVLCLLPFEPDWFQARGVPATYVGHPLFENTRQHTPQHHPALDKPASKNLALLPGSRAAEIAFNWQTMTEVAQAIREQHPDLHVIIPASDERRAEELNNHPSTKALDGYADLIVGHTHEVLDWADAALIVSGTATLEALAHNTPTVVLYNVRYLTWLFIGRFMTTTRTYSLPNLISEWLGQQRVVDEFIPHFGNPKPVTNAVNQLLSNPEAVARQRQTYQRIKDAFGNTPFAELAADAVLDNLTPRA